MEPILLFAAAARIADQLADVDFKGVGQPLERAKGRNRLAVLDLGDVGARHLHAASQLALAEVTRAADLADLTGDLQASFG